MNVSNGCRTLYKFHMTSKNKEEKRKRKQNPQEINCFFQQSYFVTRMQKESSFKFKNYAELATKMQA